MAEDGTVRVVVELDVAIQPVAQLSQSQENAQEARIEDAQEQVAVELQNTEAEVVRELENVPFMAVEVDEQALVELIQSPNVENIYIDTLVAPSLLESIPLIGADDVWGYGYNGAGQTVAILDTGVAKGHPFITAAKVISEACYSSTDAGSGSVTLCPNGAETQIGSGAGINCSPTINGCSHGTHVAGIVAGKAYTGITRNGVAPNANLISIQVFSRFGSGTPYSVAAWYSDIIAGLERVYELKNTGAISTIVAVNMSLGGGLYSDYCDAIYPAMKAAIDNLRAIGVATIIAAGNDGSGSQISFPACISSSISVGASTDADGMASFSNNANMVSLLAPGNLIISSIIDINSQYQFGSYNGTSMAAPHVAGAWALLKQAKPSATVSEILGYLEGSGINIYDARGGVTNPRIQVDAAYNLANPRPASTLTSPVNGSILSSSTVTFQWSNESALQYWLYVGTSVGGYELYNQNQGTNLSVNVGGLPTNGGTLYVRLWTLHGSAWQYNDYTFTAVTFTSTPTNTATPTNTPTPAPAKSVVTNPTNNSTLSGSSATFQWTNVSASQYWLYVGTSAGGYNLHNQSHGTNLSASVSGLPTNGAPVYVRLWTLHGTDWQFNDYAYTAITFTSTPTSVPTATSTPTLAPTSSVMVSPANGSTLGGTTVGFQWTDVSAQQYWLYVGTSASGYDLYSQGSTNTSATVSGLPANGSTIYVRLWTRHGSNWLFNDYTYTATAPAKSVVTSPTNGSVLSGSTVNFQWTDVGAAEYWMYIGSNVDTANFYNQSQGANTSANVAGLPTNGSTVHVRLWTLHGSNWLYNDFAYTAPSFTSTPTSPPTATSTPTSAPARSVVTSPANGSTLPGSTVNFQWSDVSAAEYWLYIGRSEGTYDLHSQSHGTNTSANISGLPANGSAFYVRLWTRHGSSWLYNDSMYIAAAPTKSVVTSPANGSTLSGSTVNFQWTNVGAAEYWLYLGSSAGGANIHNQSHGTNTSAAVSGLPSNGSTIYARLWTRHGSSWLYNDYTYTANAPAAITSPANGSTLSGSNVTFQWTDVSAQEYFLEIGTAPGSRNLYHGTQGVNTSATISGLPINGSTIYVRLWTLQSGVWLYNDYTYIR